MPKNLDREGIHYFDSYSPLIRTTSVMMLIVIALLYNLQVYQMDVKTALLNGDLDKEIYIEHHEGFNVKGQ